MMLGIGIAKECESEILHANELTINLFVNGNVKTNRGIDFCFCVLRYYYSWLYTTLL
jgi:hypothetical protein